MKYDVIIIGAGPAGYVAAIRAGQLGLRVALIEKSMVGGMCLNWGCIPSKALIESAKFYKRIKQDAATFGIDGIDTTKLAFNWKQATNRAQSVVKRLTNGVSFLLKKNGVEVIHGEARITSARTVTVEHRSLETDNIIIATGSYHEPLKANLTSGKVVELNQFFTLPEIPKNIVVVGESSIALELAQFFALADCNVTLAVPGEQFMPLADIYLANYMTNKLKKDKINVIFNADKAADKGKFEGEDLVIGSHRVKCDMIINSKSRKGVIPLLDVELKQESGFIVTDEYFRTSVDGIFAVGDVNGQSMFAHVGSAQGLNVINYIKGIREPLDMSLIPMNMYSDPEIAQIGRTEAQLKEDGILYKV
ncbi:MAG: hypothetical protein CVU06_02430, partial [Bacteroidetes bacterium HGW-Bacteroidetes-22]